MDDRRTASLVIVAGAWGLVAGRVLFVSDERRDLWTIWAVYFWLQLGLGLALLGLAVAHWRRSGVGAPVGVGLLAILAFLFMLNDFFDGHNDFLDGGSLRWWSSSTSAVRLAGGWLIVVSTVVLLVGVLRAASLHFGDRTPSAVWWRSEHGVALGGAAALAIVGVVGFAVFGDKDADVGPADVAVDDEPDPVQDVWSIIPDGDGDVDGSYLISLVRTFDGVAEAGVDEMGGRLVWPETEVELCDLNIWSAGDDFVQVGVVTPTTEGCPGMLPAFVQHGVPETACLFVRSGVVDDEYCAPPIGR